VKLIHVKDVVSGADTTIKVELINIKGEVEVNIHQIEGNYLDESEFNKAWNHDQSRYTLVNFISLSIIDMRKLVNSLIEEIKK